MIIYILLIIVLLCLYYIISNYTTLRYKLMCIKTAFIKKLKSINFNNEGNLILKLIQYIDIILGCFDNVLVQKLLQNNLYLYSMSRYLKIILNYIKEVLIYILKLL
jgi:hypothetical protein